MTGINYPRIVQFALWLTLWCAADLFAQDQPEPAQAVRGSDRPRPRPADVFNQVGIEQRLGETLPLGLEFTDESGDRRTLGSYFGEKPVILSLVYYRCRMLCPQVLAGMTESFRTLDLTVGKEFTVVSVSIDHRESPADARDAQTRYLPDRADGWHFLTGDSAGIARLARSIGFTYLYDEKTGQYAHASGIMIATPGGKLSRYLYGIEYGAKDLTFSLMEASEENIGSPVDKLLLLCYHYDPTTGKYGLVVANLLKAAGGLAVLLLAGYAIVNIRREKRRATAAATGSGRTQERGAAAGSASDRTPEQGA